MSNLDKLIEWMEEQDKIPYISYKDAILKAKQLQKEEPKTYAQEDRDKWFADGYNTGYEDGKLGRNNLTT
jgi:hypothetical protein